MSQFLSSSRPAPPCDLIFQNILGNQSKGNLYLGDVQAVSRQNLVGLNIRAVITLLRYNELFEKQMGSFLNEGVLDGFLWVVVQDSIEENLDAYFDKTHEFITDNLQKGNVLLHCFKGISRSATIAISYMMHGFEMNFEEAMDYVYKRRSMINPNEGFAEQLQKYDQKLQRNRRNFFIRTEISDNCQLFSEKIHKQIHYCKHIFSFKSKDEESIGHLFIGNESALGENVRRYFMIGLWVEIKTEAEMSLKSQDRWFFCVNRSQRVGDQDEKIQKVQCHSLQQLFEVINQALESNNVLIECQDGFAYSPILAAAFLSHKKQISLPQCLQYVKYKKPLSLPSQKLMQFIQQ